MRPDGAGVLLRLRGGGGHRADQERGGLAGRVGADQGDLIGEGVVARVPQTRDDRGREGRQGTRKLQVVEPREVRHGPATPDDHQGVQRLVLVRGAGLRDRAGQAPGRFPALEGRLQIHEFQYPGALQRVRLSPEVAQARRTLRADDSHAPEVGGHGLQAVQPVHAFALQGVPQGVQFQGSVAQREFRGDIHHMQREAVLGVKLGSAEQQHLEARRERAARGAAKLAFQAEAFAGPQGRAALGDLHAVFELHEVQVQVAAVGDARQFCAHPNGPRHTPRDDLPHVFQHLSQFQKLFGGARRFRLRFAGRSGAPGRPLLRHRRLPSTRPATAASRPSTTLPRA